MHYPRYVEGLLVRSSGEKGHGLFAVRAYKKGVHVIKTRGTTLQGSDSRLTHRAVQIKKTCFLNQNDFQQYGTLTILARQMRILTG